MKSKIFLLILTFAVTLHLSGQVLATASGDPAIDDQPLREALSLPDWFKVSFLDIQEDLDEAKRGRRGLIIYFGQSYCPYCKAHLRENWGRKEIVAYTRANFDVIAINTRGDRLVTDIDGNTYSEKIFSARYKATFTPTLLFFDVNGHQALKLTGYRKPYQFRAALEYVADKHHKNESFRNYLARAEGAESFGQDDLNDSNIFSSPPFNLTELKKSKPVAVFFEERRCHACDVLHAGPMLNPDILNEFNKINSIQLEMWSDTIVTTPAGKKTTARKWADDLSLSYAPTIIFYDQTGKEIIRLESVVGFFRLRNVLRYITTEAYKKQPSFQLWRSEELYKKMSGPEKK